MKSENSNPRRRDWSLIIFILPVGIILMLLSGQIAIRIIPFWSVNGGMISNIDPENPSGQQGEIAPISIDILTPMAWFDTFLTPQPDSDASVFFPPLVVFDPTKVSQTQTAAPTTMTSATPAASSTPSAPSSTPGAPTRTSVPVIPATRTYTPVPTNTPVPTATAVGVTPVGTQMAVPAQINVGAPNGTPMGTIPDGYFIIINLGTNPLVVNGPSDTGADLVYYEEPSGITGIQMDYVVISISMDGTTYYVVLNWGDGIADTNTNIGDQTPETDNKPISGTQLHNNSGVLIDVDNAPTNPPVGTYQYIAIQAPVNTPAAPGATPVPGDGIGMDSIDIPATDIPIPTPGP